MEKIKKLNEKGANIRVIEEKEMVEIVEKYGYINKKISVGMKISRFFFGGSKYSSYFCQRL